MAYFVSEHGGSEWVLRWVALVLRMAAGYDLGGLEACPMEEWVMVSFRLQAAALEAIIVAYAGSWRRSSLSL